MKTGLKLGRLWKRMLWRIRHDPFECVWDVESLSLQRSLLARVAAVAAREDVRLFLFWGTLLGHVREGRILPWDDDVDLAMVNLGAEGQDRFCRALHAAGLEIHELNPGERILKVCDPSYPRRTAYPWSWPFVDLFPYADPATAKSAFCDSLPVPGEQVQPGRLARFEGTELWEPENPLDVLDTLYPGWRETESSPPWDHRHERERPAFTRRRIRTDSTGRKNDISRADARSELRKG